MLERRGERLLLGAVLVLLTLLVLDQLVRSPVRGYVAGVDEEIGRLTERMRRARQQERLRARVEQRYRAVRAGLMVADERAQNEFRRFLEAQVCRGVEVKRVRPPVVSEMRSPTGLKIISCELDLVGTIDRLRAALQNLDVSEQLLRVEKVQITNPSLNDPRLSMQITVSTVARDEGASS